MTLKIQAMNHQRASLKIEIDRNPDKCPICNKGIMPTYCGFAFVNEQMWTNMYGIQLVYRCPFEDCQRLFIAYYRPGSTPITMGTFKTSQPAEIKGRNFSDRIRKKSPSFQNIYNQSLAAEKFNLSQVCGPGYRKALEYLIKDYLKGLHPNKASDIEKNFLGTCIQTFVNNERLKEIARRATWLANDELHYIRKWEDKDLVDLKSLINMTVDWIDLELSYHEVVKDMPDGKPTL